MLHLFVSLSLSLKLQCFEYVQGFPSACAPMARWLDYLFHSLCLWLSVSKGIIIINSYCYSITCRKLSLLLSYHKMYRVKLSTFCSQIERIRAAEALPHQPFPYFSPEPELVSMRACSILELAYTS